MAPDEASIRSDPLSFCLERNDTPAFRRRILQEVCDIFSERPCCSFAKQLRFALVDIADADLVLDLIKYGPIAKTFSQYENRPNNQLLEEHEWMLWKGSPHKGHLLYQKEIGFILFSYFWTLGLLYVIIFRISLEGMISIFPVSLIPLLMFAHLLIFPNTS